MKIIVIGGTGHIGTYLVPRLVRDGHQLICVSRGKSKTYHEDPAWKQVEMLRLDRDLSEKENSFGEIIAMQQGDIVIDLICFTVKSAELLADALKGRVRQLIHCGSMWVHGYSVMVPTREEQERKPFGNYGIQKAKIESYLTELSQKENFPATILHPGHITGPGWLPINPAGNLNPQIFYRLAEGKEISLPNIGMETVHHVHADDVAQAFQKTVGNQESIGESFHVVSEQALTLRGYAEALSEWFKVLPKIKFLPWTQWEKTHDPTDAALTWDHITHSPNGSIEKAKRILNYFPIYSSLEAVIESVMEHFKNIGYRY